MKGLIELIRAMNRARLERRHRLGGNGDLPRGWFRRLAFRIKARNHERLAQRRLRRHLLASLAANDTAVLEALVFILRTSRQDQRANAETADAVAKRLAALEERLDAGSRLVTARLQAIEGMLAEVARRDDAARPPVPVAATRPSTAGAVNGDLKRSAAPQNRVAEGVKPAAAEMAEPDGAGPRRS